MSLPPMYIGLNPVDKRHLPPQFSGKQASFVPKKLRAQETDGVINTRGSTSAATGLAIPPPPAELFPDFGDDLNPEGLNEH